MAVKTDRKSAVIQVRLSRSNKELIEEAAHLDGVPCAQFVREAAHGRALLLLIQRRANSAEVRGLMIQLVRRTGDPELLKLTKFLLEA